MSATEQIADAFLDVWAANGRLSRLSNAELVEECLKTDAADYLVVTEMMTRLHPGWESEIS